MSVPTDLKSKQQNQLNMQVREMSDEHCESNNESPFEWPR